MNVVSPRPQRPNNLDQGGPVIEFAVNAYRFVITAAVSVFFAAVVVVCIGLGSAHVLVHWLGAVLGLTDAWLHLAKIAPESASSLTDYGSLVGQNLFFGVVVGVILAAIRYKRVRSNERLRRLLEEVVSPTGYSALRTGLSCLALHLSISMAIAFGLTLLGVVLHLPGGTHVALLAVGNHIPGAGGFGGGSGPSNDDLLGMLEFLVAVIVMIAMIAGVVFTVSYWGAGRLAWSKVRWLSIGTSGATEEVSYGTAVKLGMVFFLVVMGKVSGTLPKEKPLTATQRLDQIRSVWYESHDKLLTMIFKGMLNGAIQAIIYVAAVTAGSAMFGLTGSS